MFHGPYMTYSRIGQKQHGVMAKERFANTFPFCGVKDGHDALVVAIHTFMIEAGYKCIGVGEEVGLNCFKVVYTTEYKPLRPLRVLYHNYNNHIYEVFVLLLSGLQFI